MDIEGQLSEEERSLLTKAITEAQPKVVLEIGTWLGGGSTIHILRALHSNGEGHLWGIEIDRSIYHKMMHNIRRAAPECVGRFTPIFGRSQDVIPKWITQNGSAFRIDFAFLDGGNNPAEQITEFHLLDAHIPVGGQLMAHDANMRKGKWLVPYLRLLDNWEVKIHNASEVGLLNAKKMALQPSGSSRRAARAHLSKMRCNPVEVAAAILPSRICRLVLGLLPNRLARRLSDGRN